MPSAKTRPYAAVAAAIVKTGTALVKQRTAMGPLVPLVFLVVPAALLAAWLFRDAAVFHDVPILSTILLLGAAVVVWRYLAHYARFAKNDPDRLQSEVHQGNVLRMQYLIAKNRPDLLMSEHLELPARNPALPDPDDPDHADSPPENPDEDPP